MNIIYFYFRISKEKPVDPEINIRYYQPSGGVAQ